VHRLALKGDWRYGPNQPFRPLAAAPAWNSYSGGHLIREFHAPLILRGNVPVDLWGSECTDGVQVKDPERAGVRSCFLTTEAVKQLRANTHLRGD
jgi:hypothetical protein